MRRRARCASPAPRRTRRRASGCARRSRAATSRRGRTTTPTPTRERSRQAAARRAQRRVHRGAVRDAGAARAPRARPRIGVRVVGRLSPPHADAAARDRRAHRRRSPRRSANRRRFRHRVVCDTAPLAERAFAARAGLGWIGKHTSLIVKGLGSAVFLGEIVTTLELEPDAPLRTSCGACTRCVDVCPTGALRGDNTMDATRCISDLTQRRDAIPRALRPLVGTWVWGCDLCNDACPPSVRAGRAGDARIRAARRRASPRPTCRRCCGCAARRSTPVRADGDGLARRGGFAPQRGGRARQRSRPGRRAGARRGAPRRSEPAGPRSCCLGARPHRLAGRPMRRCVRRPRARPTRRSPRRSPQRWNRPHPSRR